MATSETSAGGHSCDEKLRAAPHHARICQLARNPPRAGAARDLDEHFTIETPIRAGRPVCQKSGAHQEQDQGHTLRSHKESR